MARISLGPGAGVPAASANARFSPRTLTLSSTTAPRSSRWRSAQTAPADELSPRTSRPPMQSPAAESGAQGEPEQVLVLLGAPFVHPGKHPGGCLARGEQRAVVVDEDRQPELFLEQGAERHAAKGGKIRGARMTPAS